ncbi:hypothetical protein N7486_005720 [Penicillium sp. IBT 16267x]|nr:hypothetical protein N7486_005720 [Penicillium sp. IBT 16267x]
MASQEKRHQMVLQAQQRVQFQAAKRQQQLQSQTMGLSMATPHDYLPIVEPSDLGWIGEKPTYIVSFESACSTGSVATIQSVTSCRKLTPVTLHNGLLSTLRAGHVEAARFLLHHGAPIIPPTPENILFAPMDQQVPLFDLLAQHGWDPNNPDRNGALLLPRAVNNTHLLKWFLAHGANPNLGLQQNLNSCEALESAASSGTVEAVRILLEAGAQISNGGPLYYAAGVCPPGANPHMGTVSPSTDFDEDRIPVMELLVEHGADVNQKLETRHMVPGYPIVHAVWAGAVGRVKWLLEHGADVRLKGAFGSAVDYANVMGSDEMKRVIGDAVGRL